MLDLHRLRLLRELKHRGTLAAVAEALAYTPSAISQQLSVLETEAGVPFPERAGRRVPLTPAAGRLVEHTALRAEVTEREPETSLPALIAHEFLPTEKMCQSSRWKFSTRAVCWCRPLPTKSPSGLVGPAVSLAWAMAIRVVTRLTNLHPELKLSEAPSTDWRWRLSRP